jgi:hypothetical protein
LRRAAFLLLVVVLAAEAFLAIFVRDNDFMCHRWMGEAFLAGDPYGKGNVIYPVGRAMMNVLLAVGPLRPTRAICFGFALAALAACYWIWGRLAQGRNPVDPQRLTTKAAALTTVLVFAYLLRDLDECGLQLLWVFFLSAGAYALAVGRPAWSGFWLATGATYKVTPILFLPFLLWKRQWRAAGWMTVFLGVWTLAPAPAIGPLATVRGHGAWLAHFQCVTQNRQAYPTQLLEPQVVYNVSLQAALARNLETYPPGHPLHFDHPLFWQPGSLDQTTAYFAVRGLILTLGLVLLWCFRRPWSEAMGSNRLAVEWAAVCLLCAVLSPVCWKQHLVLILPAAFLVVWATFAMNERPVWRLAALLAIGMVINLTRDFVVGRDLAGVLLSYKVDTWAVLGLLALVLTLPADRAQNRPAALPEHDGLAPVLARSA